MRWNKAYPGYWARLHTCGSVFTGRLVVISTVVCRFGILAKEEIPPHLLDRSKSLVDLRYLFSKILASLRFYLNPYSFLWAEIVSRYNFPVTLKGLMKIVF